MDKELRLTRDIHNFVRGQLNWEESLQLFEKIVKSEELLNRLEIDMMIYQMAVEKQESENHILQFLF